MAASCRERRAWQASCSHRNQAGEESNGLITTIPMAAMLGLLVPSSVSLYSPSIAGNAAAISTNGYFECAKIPKLTPITVGQSTYSVVFLRTKSEKGGHVSLVYWKRLGIDKRLVLSYND